MLKIFVNLKFFMINELFLYYPKHKKVNVPFCNELIEGLAGWLVDSSHSFNNVTGSSNGLALFPSGPFPMTDKKVSKIFFIMLLLKDVQSFSFEDCRVNRRLNATVDPFCIIKNY
jgi:hypothetical protein